MQGISQLGKLARPRQTGDKDANARLGHALTLVPSTLSFNLYESNPSSLPYTFECVICCSTNMKPKPLETVITKIQWSQQAVQPRPRGLGLAWGLTPS